MRREKGGYILQLIKNKLQLMWDQRKTQISAN